MQQHHRCGNKIIFAGQAERTIPMKKNIKLFIAAAALSSLMSMSAFAAETHEEFRAESEPTFAKMQELNAQINPLREENNSISNRYKEILAAYKETGELPVSEETWKEIRALRRSISEFQSSKAESSVKENRAKARAASESGDYEAASEIMNGVVDSKQTRFEKLQSANAIWKQILALLNGENSAVADDETVETVDSTSSEESESVESSSFQDTPEVNETAAE